MMTMNWYKILKITAPIVLSALIITFIAILTLDTNILVNYKAFEIFGALLASAITIFGIITMKNLTEE